MVVKAARSGVNPATLSIKSVLYCHDLPHPDEMAPSAYDLYLDELLSADEDMCDHQIHDQHVEDSFASPIRCASCRALVDVPWRSSARRYTIRKIFRRLLYFPSAGPLPRKPRACYTAKTQSRLM